ncbi:MAG: ABC transporter ATP-binding protein, partial [Clostridia bacterium]
MKKLLIYLKSYKKESILGPLFKMLEASFELLVPLVVASIIDTGVLLSEKNYIIKMCAVLVAFGVIGFICSVTAQYYAAKASAGFAKKVKHALFARIQELSFTELDTLGTSTIITRMTSDINQLEAGLNLTLRIFLRSPFVVFGAMIMAFVIDFNSALVFAAVIPALLVVVFGIMLWSIPLYKKVQMKLDGVLGKTRENLAGVRVIRAFCKEKSEIDQFKEKNVELTKAQKYAGGVSALMNPITYVIINIAIILLIRTGAIRVEAGIITQGAVVALYNYMSQILVELIKLANLIISITKSIACGNRIQAVLETPCSDLSTFKTGSCGNFDKAVEFVGVNLRYKNAGANSLTNINFSVNRGETVGIIGGTGSGKSSLVNLIPRFYEATDGEIFIEGKNVKDVPIEELRAEIGVVLQKAVLFKGTIRENVKWGKKDATDDEIMNAIEVAQAKEIVEQKDGGLDYIIEQGGKNLSGGQKQRLTIARAVVKNPKILILDDSASALDFSTDASLRKAIHDMSRKLTVFIVSQRASSIRTADKIVV